MAGRELPENYRHIAAKVPAYPVFGTLFLLASVSRAVCKGTPVDIVLADLTLSFSCSLRAQIHPIYFTIPPTIPYLRYLLYVSVPWPTDRKVHLSYNHKKLKKTILYNKFIPSHPNIQPDTTRPVRFRNVPDETTRIYEELGGRKGK